VIPFSVIDLPVDGLGLGGSRTHVKQQVQVSIQHLNGEEIHLCSWVLALLLSWFAMAEKHQPIGFCGPKCHVRLWGVKGHGVQRCHTLTFKGHYPTYLEQMGGKNIFNNPSI
uniref:Uncharacterized protein n=1 Tax=Lates calcarifer TaxID=8187 RepID=A0A4W6FI51_LATCA